MKPYSLHTPYCGSIVRLSTHVTVISNIQLQLVLWAYSVQTKSMSLCMHELMIRGWYLSSLYSQLLQQCRPCDVAIMYRIRQPLSYLYNLASYTVQLLLFKNSCCFTSLPSFHKNVHGYQFLQAFIILTCKNLPKNFRGCEAIHGKPECFPP